MTGQGPRKSISAEYWTGRLRQAREMRENARGLVVLEQGSSYNGAVTLMIAAAIAYNDALTSKTKGIVNTQNHGSASNLLREVLGTSLPQRQERILRRLLGRKDEVSYGARSTPLGEAKQLLLELDEFAQWAEGAL